MDKHEFKKHLMNLEQSVDIWEASVFDAENQRLRALLREALPHVEASAGASHLTDGFRPKPANALDELVNRIKNEVKNEP